MLELELSTELVECRIFLVWLGFPFYVFHKRGLRLKWESDDLAEIYGRELILIESRKS
jgi:hypothetical protein